MSGLNPVRRYSGSHAIGPENQCQGTGQPLRDGRCAVCGQLVKTQKSGDAYRHGRPAWMRKAES